MTDNGKVSEHWRLTASADTQVEPPNETEQPSSSYGSGDAQMHYYATRQYVAYQKEIVVLSPQTAYQPNTPQTVSFVKVVQYYQPNH